LPVVERIIKVASDPGDLILDPFAGTGTVLVSSRQLGRRSMGIELSEETIALAMERLQKESKHQTLAPAPGSSEEGTCRQPTMF
jgi:site-specific DNA-methyltransferase (adenine-specific)